MKKHIAVLLLLCLLSALLCGCGAESAAPTAAPQTQTPETPAPTPAPAASEAPAPAEPPAVTEPPETEAPVNALLETAKEFIGKPAAELIAAIGAPDSSDYAPSCLGPGEDGNLYYDGFTVYTYRENGEETVRVVE